MLQVMATFNILEPLNEDVWILFHLHLRNLLIFSVLRKPA